MSSPVCKTEHKGWLCKWTNYWKGYQKRWFVLQNGFLSYYRNQSEMGHTCRGTISLVNAKIDPYDAVTFTVANGSAQTYHLRASTEADRKNWVSILTQARANALKLAQAVAQDDSASNSFFLGDSTQSADDFMAGMRSRMGDLETCERLVTRQSDMLLRALSELEDRLETLSSMNVTDPSGLSEGHLVAASNNDASSSCTFIELTRPDENGTLKEKATMLKVTVNAMMNTLKGFLEYANGNFRRWQRLLAQEREQRARLERMVEELARQHSALERKVQIQSSHAQHHRSAHPSNPADSSILDTGVAGGGKTFDGSIGDSHSTLKAESVRGRGGTTDEEDEDDSEIFFDAVAAEDDEAVTFCVALPPSMLHSDGGTGNGGAGGTDLSLTTSSTMAPGNATDESLSCYSASDEEDYTEDAAEGASGGGVEAHKSGNMVRVITRKTPKTTRAQSGTSSIRQEHRRTDSATTSRSTGATTSVNLHHSNSSTSPKEKLLTPPGVTATTSSSGTGKGITGVYRPSRSAMNLHQSSAPTRQRRTMIPPRPNISINLWSIMKNCIGKELTKIPVPVNFNEPLSMIQRIAEDFEYSRCLDEAARCDDIEQMAYVAAFTASSYSPTVTRTSKPFNPLLGETFECDRREDFGWRLLSEQVSHHPPALACHCESDLWCSWQEFSMTSKFRGKYLSIVPQGISHLTFTGSDNHYTWRKVTTTVHNIIVGRLWIDNHGEMDIFNHANGVTCHLSYKPYSYFSRDEPRRVMGVIYDKEKTPKYMLRGCWDQYMEGAHITNIRNNDWETGPWTSLWRKDPGPTYAEKMYNFTLLAMQLNEPEDGVAPSDSRLRPDLRLMEEGKWDEANKEKERLEEKQRAKRRAKEEEMRKLGRLPADGEVSEEHEPVWFKPTLDPQTGKKIHLYNGLYWECKEKGDWSNCPDIF